MGLTDDLSYAYPRPNVFRRAMQAFAATRWGAWFFSKTLAPMDRLLSRVSRGRLTVPALMAGLPVPGVTRTGRKSGLRRPSYLIAVPVRDTLALLGTNFGQPSTPAWVLNLEADPRATLSHHGVTLEAVARPATADEHAAVLAGSAAVYGGYLKYQQRITDRRLRIF